MKYFSREGWTDAQISRASLTRNLELLDLEAGKVLFRQNVKFRDDPDDAFCGAVAFVAESVRDAVENG